MSQRPMMVGREPRPRSAATATSSIAATALVISVMGAAQGCAVEQESPEVESSSAATTVPADAFAVGSRYLAIALSPGTEPVALRVIGADPGVSCVSSYVQADWTLGPTPLYLTPQQWVNSNNAWLEQDAARTAGRFSGAVYVHGRELVAARSYTVEVVSRPGSPPAAAADLTLWEHGDVDNDGRASFVDIGLTVDGFKGKFSESTTACTSDADCSSLPVPRCDTVAGRCISRLTLYNADLTGPDCVPNADVNFIDIGHAVEGFKQVQDPCDPAPEAGGCVGRAPYLKPLTLESDDSSDGPTIQLRWYANNPDEPIDDWNIYRSLDDPDDPGCRSADLFEVSRCGSCNAHTFRFEDLVAGAEHRYSVRGVTADGTLTPCSNVVTLEEAVVAGPWAPVVTDVILKKAGEFPHETEMTLRWDNGYNGPGVPERPGGFHIYVNKFGESDTGCEPTSIFYFHPGDTTSRIFSLSEWYYDTTGTLGISIQIEFPDGTLSPCSQVVSKPILRRPRAPEDFLPVATSEGPRIFWNPDPEWQGYYANIYRTTSSAAAPCDPSNSLVKDRAESNSQQVWYDRTAEPYTTYYYSARGYRVGNGLYSTQCVTGTLTTGADPTPADPAPPTNVTATRGSVVGEVRVTWTPSADADGVRIYRSSSPDDPCNEAKLHRSMPASDGATYRDGVDPGQLGPPASNTLYYYSVKSFALDPSRTSVCSSDQAVGHACIPTTSCIEQDKDCGEIDNGCGTELCGPFEGECPDGSVCEVAAGETAGNCSCEPDPAVTCAGYECGKVYDGCRWIDCGVDEACASTKDTCNIEAGDTAGTCVDRRTCTPRMDCLGICGTVSDGCGGLLNCGRDSCDSHEICNTDTHQCIPAEGNIPECTTDWDAGQWETLLQKLDPNWIWDSNPPAWAHVPTLTPVVVIHGTGDYSSEGKPTGRLTFGEKWTQDVSRSKRPDGGFEYRTVYQIKADHGTPHFLDSAEKLADCLRDLRAGTNSSESGFCNPCGEQADRFSIVGHSQGGLLVDVIMSNSDYADVADAVTTAVSVAGPLGGSPAASAVAKQDGYGLGLYMAILRWLACDLGLAGDACGTAGRSMTKSEVIYWASHSKVGHSRKSVWTIGKVGTNVLNYNVYPIPDDDGEHLAELGLAVVAWSLGTSAENPSDGLVWYWDSNPTFDPRTTDWLSGDGRIEGPGSTLIRSFYTGSYPELVRTWNNHYYMATDIYRDAIKDPTTNERWEGYVIENGEVLCEPMAPGTCIGQRLD